MTCNRCTAALFALATSDTMSCATSAAVCTAIEVRSTSAATGVSANTAVRISSRWLSSGA